MEAFILCIVFTLVMLVIISLKEKENPFENIAKFFQEWWDNYRLPALWATIGLAILAIFGFVISG